ncbi:hypothetical protein HRbin02_01428 [Candidatus Calditenuaceae archaeon HR02]|nr:hypothetical protein HRbin02_01428 [Candidatus Calditenuaceae archaeon HR02]
MISSDGRKNASQRRKGAKLSAKNPTPYTGRRKSKGRPSKFNELLWLLKRNNYAKYQEEIRKSTETSVSQRTIENYIRECVVEGVPLRRFRILRRIPFINRLKFRPLFTQKIGDRVLIYAPYVFPGKESVSILMWNAIILLYAFTGYILIQPQLVQYALLIYLVLSVSVAIRILVWYLFARSYGLYRKWKIAIIMKGKPHYTVSLDGNTTVRQIIEMALKFFSPK